MLLEKAKEYAQDCISGKEITTFEVKTQCKWFLEDLEKGYTIKQGKHMAKWLRMSDS